MTRRNDVDRKLHPAIISAAAIASGLAGDASFGAPGDLDGVFGDVGRVAFAPDLAGAVWALEGDGADPFDVAAGDDYCSYYSYDSCDAWGFVGFADGSSKQGRALALPELANTEFRDLERQTDGKLVGIGWTSQARDSALTLFRLAADRSLDATFGAGGIVSIKGTVSASGGSVLLEPDGRIVAAGMIDGRATVLRLTPSGVADLTFAAAGRYDGPDALPSIAPRVVRTPAGAYRLLTQDAAGCRVTGLVSAGTPDISFGEQGSATPRSPAGRPFQCAAIVAQPDGKLVIIGSAQSGSLAVRLLADGTVDPSFSSAGLEAKVASASAVALAPDGTIYVGGAEMSGLPGSAVARLLPDGSPDSRYGIGGLAVIDVNVQWGYFSSAESLRVLRDGGVLVGGTYWYDGKRRPYVAKLLGSGDGPGVVGMKALGVIAGKKDGQAIVTVRRTGGTLGPVSVAYSTVDGTAIEGRDYVGASGRLDWAAGDGGLRTITVPIASTEDPSQGEKMLAVKLSEPTGGAGVGASMARVTIAGLGYPSGEFDIYAPKSTVLETEGSATFVVKRMGYSQGPASVIVTPASGTATLGSDFTASTVVLNWGAGDNTDRFVTVQVLPDRQVEGDETFTLSLSSQSAGAVLGASSSATVTIQDVPPKKSGGGGGGGSEDGSSVGLLGLLSLARRWLGRRLSRPAE